MKNIFLIDDDPAINYLHSLVIKRNGICEVLKAEDSAHEALLWLSNECNPKPDLIFLDINMPRMNGWEFLEEYRRISSISGRKIPIILLSSSTNPNDIKKAKNIAEVTEYSNKPLTKISLNDILKRHCAD